MPISPVKCFAWVAIPVQLSRRVERSQRCVSTTRSWVVVGPFLLVARTRHPYKPYRQKRQCLCQAESPIITAGPIINHAAQPRSNSCTCADKQRDRADDRAKGLAVK